MPPPSQDVLGSLPRPAAGVKAALLTLFGVWLALAVAINWGGASPKLFVLLCGSNALILQGEVWRLVTGPLLHDTSRLSHILFTLLGVYFLSPSLEQSWGARRYLRFLALSAVGAYAFQLLVWMILPASIAGRLVPEYWYGATPVVEAIAIAWALSFRGQTVRLMMLIPVTSRTLVLFVVGVSVLAVIALSRTPSGLVAPFGGMLAGWLLGGGRTSPFRRWWLRQKLAQTERALQVERDRRQRRIAQSPFRVIDGGSQPSDDRESAPPSSDPGASGEGRGPDGRLLN